MNNPCNPNRNRANTLKMPTTIAVSTALKQFLEEAKQKNVGLSSMNDVVLSIIKHPQDGEQELAGYDEKLTEKIAVEEFTRNKLEQMQDVTQHGDYEAVIRDCAGLEARKYHEQPIEVE